ncbi:MAG: hypothetical protein JOZ15_20945 [Acidobacteria bacterium]|nr:hypothetical protein [Acidobacteriota bacterium]
MHPRPSLLRTLAPALLLAGALALPARGFAAPYPDLAHLDGYLHASGEGECVMLRQHDGRTYALRGELGGLRSGDHVRLAGRFAPDPGCGAPGFAVTAVLKLWADDNHRTAYFDDQNGEPFARYAERIGRFSDQGAPGEERRDARDAPDAGDGRERGERQEHGEHGNAGGGPEPERPDAGRERDRPDPERADRNGGYVYHGPHRAVTLVGTLHEIEGACPTLHTTHAVFALDGSLRDYRAGDEVSVSGVLYEGDPNAPCGGPTVVVRKIHGHGR